MQRTVLRMTTRQCGKWFKGWFVSPCMFVCGGEGVLASKHNPVHQCPLPWQQVRLMITGSEAHNPTRWEHMHARRHAHTLTRTLSVIDIIHHLRFIPNEKSQIVKALSLTANFSVCALVWCLAAEVCCFWARMNTKKKMGWKTEFLLKASY